MVEIFRREKGLAVPPFVCDKLGVRATIDYAEQIRISRCDY